MTDPTATPPADEPLGEEAPPAAAAAPSATTDAGAGFLKTLPAEYRDDPNFKNYKTIGDWAKSHLNLVKTLGREPRVPAKDAPPDVWDQFYSALGRPDTPDKYTIEAPEGLEVNDKMLTAYRETAHKLGLTHSQAAKLAQWQFEFAADERAAMDAELEQTSQRVEREMRREYGKAYEQSIGGAIKVAQEYGGDELVSWLESGRGNNQPLIRALVKISRALGEDKLGTSRRADFALDPASAQTEIRNLGLNKDFQAALNDRDHPGHKAAIERRMALFEAAYPTEDTAA